MRKRRNDVLRRMRVEMRELLGDHGRWTRDRDGEGAAFARRTLAAIRLVLHYRRSRLPVPDVRVTL